MVGKLKLFALVALCLPLCGAWPNTGQKYPTTAAAYVGPGDVVAAQGWWGLRAYSHALAIAGPTTTPVIDVLGTSTVTGCTIYLKGDGTGGLDLTTSGAGGVGHQCASGATTFCTVTNSSCTVSKIYDQSGSNSCVGMTQPCPLTQATAADQPTFQFTAGPGGNPSMLCPGTTVSLNFVANNYGGTLTQPFTFAVVSAPGSTAATAFTAFSNTALFFYTSSFTLVGLYSGSASANVTVTNAWHAFGALYSGTSSLIYTDGSASGSLSPGTNSMSSQPRFCTDQFNNAATVQVAEAGIWQSGLSGAQQSSLSSSAHNAYGF